MVTIIETTFLLFCHHCNLSEKCFCDLCKWDELCLDCVRTVDVILMFTYWNNLFPCFQEYRRAPRTEPKTFSCCSWLEWRKREAGKGLFAWEVSGNECVNLCFLFILRIYKRNVGKTYVKSCLIALVIVITVVIMDMMMMREDRSKLPNVIIGLTARDYVPFCLRGRQQKWFLLRESSSFVSSSKIVSTLRLDYPRFASHQLR